MRPLVFQETRISVIRIVSLGVVFGWLFCVCVRARAHAHRTTHAINNYNVDSTTEEHEQKKKIKIVIMEWHEPRSSTEARPSRARIELLIYHCTRVI